MAAAERDRERWILPGATALVTGGSKGIGHAIVEELAALGARVHTCSRNAAELEECRRRWAEKGGGLLQQVTVSVCDVAVRADREALMATVRDVFGGKLDILVNNAAQVVFKPAVECTGEEYTRIMATNLESCFHLSQLAHPLLRDASLAGGGSVVHISSTAGLLGFRGAVLYSTAKGSKLGGRRARNFTDSAAAGRRAGRGGVRGVVSVHAGGRLRHRPSHLR
ncbi:tropinone reductase 2 isoform X1 [Zea mays]|uniref:tropinone reductase 2 isoform X1 n=1 Tax=Zea mays TaxID=4577 RepID=UPI0004DE9F80|nr:tropinone reductase 2 isoform X1 [Zea mays]|eukprot:XP_008677223.1 tropinone reductase 2 isoform X1 [Zea mays]